LKPFDTLVRRLMLQPDFIVRSNHPYRLGRNIRIDEKGVHLTVWSRTPGSADAVARQHVLRTLEENGIPPEVVEIEAQKGSCHAAIFIDQNPTTHPCSLNIRTVGCRQRLTFPLTEKAEGWFVSDQGVISASLRLVPLGGA